MCNYTERYLMSTYIDSLILFILCASCYPAESIDPLHIMGIVFLIAIYCFKLALNTALWHRYLDILGLLLCFLLPELSVFLPFFCYISFYNRQYGMPALFLLPIARYLYKYPSYGNLFLFFIAILCAYLAYTNLQRNHLQKAVYHLRDNSVEKELLLRQKNRHLLESQNDQIYIATLKERNRIAREIHDNVGHMLSRSILQLGAILAVSKDEALKPHLEGLKDSLNLAMDNIRNSVHDLHDESVDLSYAIKDITDNFSFCPVSLSCDISNQVPKNIKYCFLAIIKEALNNTARHSSATRAAVTLKEHPAFYQLLIEDNGKDVPKNIQNIEEHAGIGLSNMKERIEALHGIFRISTEQGFRIFISVPKEETNTTKKQ